MLREPKANIVCLAGSRKFPFKNTHLDNCIQKFMRDIAGEPIEKMPVFGRRTPHGVRELKSFDVHNKDVQRTSHSTLGA